MQERYGLKLLFLLIITINVNNVVPQETIQYSPHQTDPRQRTVIMRLEPLPDKPPFLSQAVPPRAIPQSTIQSQASIKNDQSEFKPRALPQSQQPNRIEAQQKVEGQKIVNAESPVQFTVPTVAAQQPVIPPLNALGQPILTPREDATPPPAPPMNIPTDVQNQLIKFLGLDSFGIPGLTGTHPKGFAGAVEELRSQGIPIQGLPLEHVGGQPIHAPQNDALVQANPKFGNELNSLLEGSRGPFNPSGGSAPLPDAKPGDNGLIGLLSSSVRRFVKDSGVADALSNTLPNVLGTNQNVDAKGSPAVTQNSQSLLVGANDSIPQSQSVPSSGVRRQQSPAERALAGFASALGGGNSNGPAHAGLPRIPGIPILPGGIPRNSQGQIDVVQLIGSITRRISNGTTLADVIPPEQLQTLADNVTDALLPATPEDFDLNKFMGRWFEGINSPRATEQRCVVHHYGGLTRNERTATFTALKIYREGSEFGPVKYSIGYAFRAGNKDAMLQLHSSENADAQPFWVYKLGPEGNDPFGNKQYEYAIVSNWVKYPVTVLVRDPDTFKAKYEVEVLRWLEDQGFINGFIRAFNLLQPASYGSCQYADNTFELFGRK
uniref:Lipocalin domain-containing protein n=1 Tax=Meloidogyne incognita TaxID=6306 RepID=A0A914L9C0_MELIC